MYENCSIFASSLKRLKGKSSGSKAKAAEEDYFNKRAAFAVSLNPDYANDFLLLQARKQKIIKYKKHSNWGRANPAWLKITKIQTQALPSWTIW